MQINKKQGQNLSLLQKLLLGPVVDKFFFFAAISSFFASAYLGTHMWLMLQGQTPPWEYYYALRELHAVTQIYVFFGLFIAGFLFQAAPKVFDVPGSSVNKIVLVMPILVLLGVILSFDWFFPLAGRIIIFASFALAALAIFPIIRNASAARIFSIGIPVLISFSAFSLGAFLPLSRSVAAVLVIWIGVLGAVLSASQQFAAGFLGGKKMEIKHGIPFLFVFSLSCIFMVAAYIFENSGSGMLWQITSAFCTLSILSYLFGSRTWKTFLNPFGSALTFAVATGIIWGLIGCYQMSQGMLWLDLALHSWALGWGIPLIIVISLQIISFLSGGELLTEKSKFILLLLWLPVPLFRSVFHKSHPFTAWLIAVLATIVLVVWVMILLKGIYRISQRQIQLKESSPLPQC